MEIAQAEAPHAAKFLGAGNVTAFQCVISAAHGAINRCRDSRDAPQNIRASILSETFRALLCAALFFAFTHGETPFALADGAHMTSI